MREHVSSAMVALALAFALVAALAQAQPSAFETRTLDRFDTVDAWKAIASDGVHASISRVVDGKRAAYSRPELARMNVFILNPDLV